MLAIILEPTQGGRAYHQAAQGFQDMYEKVTGCKLKIVDADDGISDLFVIGSDAVNDFLMDEMIKDIIELIDEKTKYYCKP